MYKNKELLQIYKNKILRYWKYFHNIKFYFYRLRNTTVLFLFIKKESILEKEDNLNLYIKFQKNSFNSVIKTLKQD